MATYTVALSAEFADFIAESARAASVRVALDRDTFAHTGEIVVTMTETAKDHFESLASETDGFIDDAGMWINAWAYPITVLA